MHILLPNYSFHAALHTTPVLVPIFSLLFPLSQFLGCQTHPFEDENSKDVWLSLKTLKRRVARLVDVGLQVFLCFHEAGTTYLCFKLSKLGLNDI